MDAEPLISWRIIRRALHLNQSGIDVTVPGREYEIIHYVIAIA